MMTDQEYIKQLEQNLHKAESDRDTWKIYCGCVVIAFILFCMMVAAAPH